jgi:prepilin-type N-terminal cleavage/methylation domain-containing protein
MRRHSLYHTRRAFTLVEMLAVIGIIVLLVGILVPTVMSARRAADKNAARMELQTIAMALDAYRADFGDYPRPTAERRERVLAWALIGPYDETAIPKVNDPYTGSTPLVDGANGPGFRTVKGGKVWGPYLPPDKFRLVSDDDTIKNTLRWDIMDRYSAPIEYYPQWHAFKPGQGMHLFGSYASSNLADKSPANANNSVYDYRQQWADPPTVSTSMNPRYPAVNYLRKALGDDNLDDVIDAQEVPKEMPPFLLISRGPTRQYSTDAEIRANLDTCPEITNLQH